MHQEKTDQEWQKPESRIDKFADKFLRHNFLSIEHKPLYLPLVALPQENENDEKEELFL
ncbi:MAG TPA: hypothetical protein VMU29_07710 [Smithella sp.]|nr:hypothetical protein [Smithella sp.]